MPETFQTFENIYIGKNGGLILKLSLAVFFVYRIIISLEHEKWFAIFFLTNVNFFLTTIILWLLLFQHLLNLNRSGFISKVIKICFSANTSASFLVIIFYWTVLPYVDLLRIYHQKNPDIQNYEFTLTRVRHVLVPMTPWLILLTERTDIPKTYFKYTVFYSFSYLTLNYIGCQTLGRPIYSGMDWKSTVSHIQITGALAIAFAGFFVSSSISERMEELMKIEDPKNEQSRK